jgi:hypothetical protein
MNYIAMGGSQVGNFSYIDTRENNYEQKVKDSLSESLDIAMEGSNALKLNLTSEEQGIDVSHNLESNFEFSAVEEVDGMPVIENVVLSCQAIVKTEEIEGLQAHICNRESRVQFALSMEKVHDPSDDVMLKAQLKSTNMKIFELIQAVQKPDSDRKAIFEEMSQLDEALNGYIETSMKIKDRELRKELMEQAQNAKLTASKVVGVLRGALNNNLSNATIAELNHCAFAGIRKTGQQKRLDERALKNESIFKANDQKLKSLVKSFDLAKLSETHKDLITDLGDCPMSQCNAIELLKEGDCMCLTLDISRSEACINDPTKLIVNQIHPSFMSLDSFLDSSIFNLKKNQDAAGGFDYK